MAKIKHFSAMIYIVVGGTTKIGSIVQQFRRKTNTIHMFVCVGDCKSLLLLLLYSFYISVLVFFFPIRAGGSCARGRGGGGWWWGRCACTQPTGQYRRGRYQGPERGVTWWHWKDSNYSLKTLILKFRPLEWWNSDDKPKEWAEKIKPLKTLEKVGIFTNNNNNSNSSWSVTTGVMKGKNNTETDKSVKSMNVKL